MRNDFFDLFIFLIAFIINLLVMMSIYSYNVIRFLYIMCFRVNVYVVCYSG